MEDVDLRISNDKKGIKKYLRTIKNKVADYLDIKNTYVTSSDILTFSKKLILIMLNLLIQLIKEQLM